MKNKFLAIFVLFLFFSVVIVQFKIFRLEENQTQDTSGQVKSAETSLSSQSIPILDSGNLLLTPKKIKKFHEANIYAKSYILYDINSGYILSQKNANIQLPIASTTKILTAIIVLENYHLNDTVVISKNAASQIGSEVMLKSGEKITIESLLYALLIQSGNDAALALAENYPGDVKEFVNAMNAKASYLGLKNTHLKDPAGLDDEGKSTAHDLAILTAYALRNPTFSKIVKTVDFDITSIDGRITHKLESSNRLIKSDQPLYYPLAIGVKTGFTPIAGHCLVAAAEKNGRKIISIVLNTDEFSNDASAEQSKKLLEWGFENFEL